jgi:curved DNA-binding protein
LKIPPGSSSGRRLRVKGQGVRDSSGIAGDLFVELQIKLPEPLSAGAELSAELSAETLRSIEHIESLYASGLRTKVVW